jgi:hypothetical protein
MAQYIQHPALIGAQQGNEFARQQMNLVGQAIQQFSNARNAAAQSDFAEQMKTFEQLAGIGMGPGGRGGAPGGAGTAMDAKQALGNKLKLLQAREFARAGVDYTKKPDDELARIGFPNTPITGTPFMQWNDPDLNLSGVNANWFGGVPISSIYGIKPTYYNK